MSSAMPQGTLKKDSVALQRAVIGIVLVMVERTGIRP